MMKRILTAAAAIAVLTTTAHAGVKHRIAWEHPTDCPSNITQAVKRQLCVDLDDGRLWRCQPTAANCTVGEWEPVGQVEIQEEGASLPLQPAVNFIGAAMTCVDNPGSSRTDCTITGGSVSFSDLTTGENTAATMSVGSGASLIHSGGILGASKAFVLARKGSVGSISPCAVVFVSGFNPGTEFVEVELADADASGQHPALGIVDTTVTNSSEGQVTVSGALESRCDTSAFSVTDRIYLSTTPGQFSARPTADNEVVQPIGLVLRSHATQGRIAVVGAGNENDLPNLISGTNVTSGSDPGHAHTGASVSGFVLDTGDTMTGDLVMDDGAGDSPAVSFVPAAATTWSLFTADADGDFRLEANTASTEIFEIFNIGAGVADLDVEGDISGGNVTSGTDPGHTHSAAAAGWEALTNTADTATAFVGSADAETVTFDFQSAFGADRFSIKQTAGNPTAGTLFDLRAADPDVVVFRAGDGTNGITVDQAGFIRSEGSGKINADCIDDDQDGNCEVFTSGDGTASVQEFVGVASAVNFIKTTNAITAAGPTIAAEGETNVDLTVTAKGSGTLKLEGGGDANEGLVVNFSDGGVDNPLEITDTACADGPCFLVDDDDLQLYASGGLQYFFTRTSPAAMSFSQNIQMSNGGGSPMLRNVGTLATVPTLIPDQGDQDTGIGQATANQLSLIAGGVEGIRIVTVASGVNRVEVTPGITAVGPTIAAEGETNVDLNLAAKGTGDVVASVGDFVGGNVTSGADPGHTHTGAFLSGLDISDDTNLSVTAPITVSGDTLGITQDAGTDVTQNLEEEAQIAATNITGNAADNLVLIGTAANAAGWTVVPDCNDTTEKIDWNAGVPACVTDQTGADGFGYDEVLDEASGLTKRAQLNFIGAGVTCVDNGGATRTDCTIPGGAGNSFGTIGLAVADAGADTLTVSDSSTIDFTTTDDPEDLTAAFLPAGIGSVTWLPNANATWTFDIAAGDVNPTMLFRADDIEIDAHLELDDQRELRWQEEDAGGANFLAMRAPAAVTSDQLCTLEDDANFIPDTCVGDGVDGIGTDTLDDLSDDAITALSDVTAKTGTGTTVVFSIGPALTGDPTVPTAAANDSDTSAASTAYVQQEINGAGGTGLTCGTGTCNVDLGTSIDSSEIEADVIVAADVAASLDTRSTQIIFPNPAITDEFVVKLPPVIGTMTRIDCETVGATSMTIKLCDGEDVGDDTCTTNILDATETTTLVCTDAGASDTSLNSAGFVARDDVTLVITAVSGSPTQGILYITSTVD